MRIFIIFIFLFTLNCSSNKVSNNHGLISLQTKFEKITINKTNKNDVINIIGPPSSISKFDENKWFYIQRIKTNQSLFKLGIKKIKKNDILIVKFNNRGIIEDKKILSINDMKDIKFSKNTTDSNIINKSFLYNFFNSIRQKINEPIKKSVQKK